MAPQINIFDIFLSDDTINYSLVRLELIGLEVTHCCIVRCEAVAVKRASGRGNVESLLVIKRELALSTESESPQYFFTLISKTLVY